MSRNRLQVKIPRAEQKRFRRFLRKHVKKSKQEVKKDVQAAGLVAETKAAEEAPVDTGRLRQNIKKLEINEGYGADIGTNVEYAKFQEYGTRYIKGRHFMLKGGRAGAKYLLSKLTKG